MEGEQKRLFLVTRKSNQVRLSYPHDKLEDETRHKSRLQKLLQAKLSHLRPDNSASCFTVSTAYNYIRITCSLYMQTKLLSLPEWARITDRKAHQTIFKFTKKQQ